MGGQNVLRASRKTWVKLTGAAIVAAGLGFAAFTGPAATAADTAAKPVDFKRDIQPVLNQSCVKCHREDPKNPRGPAAKLRLDDKAAAMKGGKSGVAIVPGKADESLFYKLLAGPATVGDHEIAAMPKPQRNQPFKPLPKDKVELIKHWIDQGAKWE
jgi:mono/diheme cytochrome c family protein